MLTKLSEPQVRTLGFVLGPVVVVGCTLLAYSVGGYGLTAIVAIASTVVLALLSRALTPPWFGRTRAQIYSLAVLAAAALAVLAPDTLGIPIIESVFNSLKLDPPSVPSFCGLEVDTPKLRLLVNDEVLDRHLTALRASRLARLGGSPIQRFSFAHRRFESDAAQAPAKPSFHLRSKSQLSGNIVTHRL